MLERIGLAFISLAIGVWIFYLFVSLRSDPFIEVTGDTVRSVENVTVGDQGIPDGEFVLVNDYKLKWTTESCYYVSMVLVILAWFCLRPLKGRLGSKIPGKG